jgi:prepilin-type N-terminal cleavage/methylation domain-containing protein
MKYMFQMKTSILKLSTHRNCNSAGFTLIELLVSIVIMGLVSSFISYAVGSMITSNQSLAKEQNRRVEASRAIDLIANDVRISTIQPSTTSAPSGVTGTIVLDLLISSGSVVDGSSTVSACSDSTKNRIVYLIKPSTSGSEIGPNVLYRYGLVAGSNGKINCADTLPTDNGYPIADAINNAVTTPVTCNTPAVFRSSSGFYSCTSDNQVSIALFSKLSSTKTYGINRTINSGFIPSTPTATEDCTVPDLTSSAATANTPSLANDAIRDATPVTTTTFTPKLLSNGINIENGSRVQNQSPLPGAKLACGKGLVTYTY